jgi:hypothetical protein
MNTPTPIIPSAIVMMMTDSIFGTGMYRSIEREVQTGMLSFTNSS